MMSHQSNIAEVAIASVELILAAFDGARKCFQLISLTKNCNTDVKPIVVTLRNANLQVSRWGETVGLTGVELDKQSVENHLPKGQRNGAEETLRTIKALMDKIKDSTNFAAEGMSFYFNANH